MKNTEIEIKLVLEDVRKAYRLLFAYQSRVLDIVKFIGNQLSYDYHGGWPKFSNSSPKDGKGSLDLWAWDWLNMYCYGFHFKEKDLGIKGKFNFSVILVSDTGFYDYEENPNQRNKQNLNNFTDSHKSETKLILLYGKNRWIHDAEKFERIYKANEKQLVDERDDGVLLAKSYELFSFADSESSLRQIGDFVRFCRSHGLHEIKTIDEGIHASSD